MNERYKNLGIISLVSSFIAIFAFGLPLGAVGLITGIISWDYSDYAKFGAVIGALDVILVLAYMFG